MKKILVIIKMRTILTLIFIITLSNVIAQPTVTVYARLHSVAYDTDTIQVEQVETVTFDVDSVSDIIAFGEIQGIKFGWKVEILESKISDIPTYIVSTILYQKANAQSPWRPIYETVDKTVINNSEFEFDFVSEDKKGYHNSIGTTPHGNIEQSFYMEYDLKFKWK